VPLKVVLNPVFLRSTNLEIHADRLFVYLVRILGDFPFFLSASASNNAFIVKMWLGGAPHVASGLEI